MNRSAAIGAGIFGGVVLVATTLYLITRGSPTGAATSQKSIPPLPPILQISVCPINSGTGMARCINATAFYAQSAGRKFIVAPYHLWSMNFITPADPSSVQIVEYGPSGGFAAIHPNVQVLAADRQEDIVLLQPPADLENATPLSLEGGVTIGEAVSGIGFGTDGEGHATGWFSGIVQDVQSITETSGGVSLNVTPDAVQVVAAVNAFPGDSGAPVINAQGLVVGEDITFDSGHFYLASSTAIRALAQTLPLPTGQPFIQVGQVKATFINWVLCDLAITLKNTGTGPSTVGQYGLCITAHLSDANGPVISRQNAGAIPALQPGEQMVLNYSYSLPLGTLAGHYYWFEVMTLCVGCPQDNECEKILQMQVL